MLLLARLSCLFGRHRINRRKVRYEGDVRVCLCASCGMALERRDGGRWHRRAALAAADDAVA
jgi:hypothetical protein